MNGPAMHQCIIIIIMLSFTPSVTIVLGFLSGEAKAAN